MSARALTWAWQQVPEKGAEKLVLAALADRADEDGYCWPSLRWLAAKCAPLSERHVRRSVIALERQNLLVKVDRKRRQSGAFSVWVYRLNLPTSGHIGPLAEASPVATGGQSRRDDQELTTTSEEVVATSGHRRPVGNIYVQFFVDECRRLTGTDPLPNAKARIGKYTNDLLNLDVEDATIRAAITEIVSTGLGVGSFPGVVDQLHRKSGMRQSTADLLAEWKEKYGL
jgi:hypothetical protein